MIRELILSLIGRYWGKDSSVNGNGLPPQHTIIDEEVFTHKGIKYLAMRIRAPNEPDYVIVGVITKQEAIVKESGSEGVARYVRMVDPQNVEGLAKILGNTGFNETTKYYGEKECKFES